jgi:ribonuclease VapC
MVVDSSAIVAVLRMEPEAHRFSDMMNRAESRRMAASNLLEVTMVMSNQFGEASIPLLDGFLVNAEIEIVPFTNAHAAIARQAFLKYGKGRHPAGLNFGDCIAYATARLEMMPLLFKGDDFRLTDVEVAG